MKPILIGHAESKPLTLDPAKLVDTRALIQANSGGGKSWLMRLIAEQAAPQVQTIILDPEGEFVTLREKVDCVIVGRDGEIPCDPRSASLLARRLMEINVSAVIDLYDLKLPQRRQFVRLFCEALIDLPRPLWHSALIMLDEAHLFAPQDGDCEATGPVIGMMAQGRKRGYCGILATQRLSKLHKDAAAECNNVFIGRTWLDNDAKRAGDLLGMDKAAQRELRSLEAGEFFAFGPALSIPGVVRFKSSQVATTHPKAGSRHTMEAPRPSKAIQRVIGELSDLPQQAEAEIKDLAAAKKRIQELEREAKNQPAAAKPVIDQSAIDTAVSKRDAWWQAEWKRRTKALRADADKCRSHLNAASEAIAAGIGEILDPDLPPAGPEKRQSTPTNSTTLTQHIPRPSSPQRQSPTTADPEGFTGYQSALLRVLIDRYPVATPPSMLGTLSHKSTKSSAFGPNLKSLVDAGLAERRGNSYVATDAGIASMPGYQPAPPSGREALNYWLGKLPRYESDLLRTLADVYPARLTKDAIAERSQKSLTSSAFGPALKALVDNEFATNGDGAYSASDVFFEGA